MDDNTGLWLGGFAGIIILIAVGVFIYLKTNTYGVTASVTATLWQRDINVEQFKALAENTYESQMPGDAYNVQRYTTSHSESYTCGWEESCSGTGSYRYCSDEPITCWRSVTDYMARYTVNRWIYDRTLRNIGGPQNEMVWPDFTPQPDAVLGHDREASRLQQFFITFTTADNKNTYTYSTINIDEWRTYPKGSDVTFQVNRLNEPQWATLKKGDMH